MKGKFITFEGIDGSGKTTQIELLKKELINKGVTTLVLREPGGTKLSEKIREILLNRKNIGLHAVTEPLLFVAARAQLIAEKIKPSLEQNKFVICDRFIDSTVAYQGYGRGMNVKLLETLNNFAIDNIQPHLTIILDIEPEVATSRVIQETPDRMESNGIDFFERVRNGYYSIAASNKERCEIIDGNQSKMEISNSIIKLVNNKLFKENPCI